MASLVTMGITPTFLSVLAFTNGAQPFQVYHNKKIILFFMGFIIVIKLKEHQIVWLEETRDYIVIQRAYVVNTKNQIRKIKKNDLFNKNGCHFSYLSNGHNFLPVQCLSFF
ncbi:hypothetical protein GDO78_010585 [Eleutherodactylus coqui]|uniref:Uncharacterized protein n=1 Tax=Eleutherodactylus coqui TaxID=57060 RepID=A0A8J6F5F4_ELECQ|nr:hypothetical protein GDO78_010585 [Eleutherodactylus coqui]